MTSSAFGYDEAQLRFHEGNAWTHLGDTGSAWTAHERALQLYPASDYLDRSMIMLDRAACLARDGDTGGAAHHLVTTLSGLTPEQRSGLLLARASEVYHGVPAPLRGTTPVREVGELLALCATQEKESVR